MAIIYLEVIFMSYLKWPLNSFKKLISFFSQVINNFINNFKKTSKKKAIIQILILLIAVNGIFWVYRATRRQYAASRKSKREYPKLTQKSTKEWKVELDENLNQNLKKEEMKNKVTKKNEARAQTKKEVEPKSIDKNPKTTISKISNFNRTEETNVQKTESLQDKTEPVLATMALPVLGKVITAHSVDNLVYSKTLEQWSAHKGIDVSAEIGAPVKCAMNGVIEDVKIDDPKLGVVITVDHGNDIKTVYGNLSKSVSIGNGDVIKKGQIIGQVGRSAPFEIEDPPHLHFEVLKNGKNINPQQFLPKLN